MTKIPHGRDAREVWLVLVESKIRTHKMTPKRGRLTIETFLGSRVLKKDTINCSRVKGMNITCTTKDMRW